MKDEFKGLRGQSYGGRRVVPDGGIVWMLLSAFYVAVLILLLIAAVVFAARAVGADPDPITATFGAPTASAKTDPVQDARRELGRMLYHDRRVGDGTTSCADCHRLDRGGSDGRKLAVGRIGSPGFPQGRVGTRHTPDNLNEFSRFTKSQFWDGRARDLVEQALGPIANHDEMADQTPQQMCNRLNRIAGYRALAQAAFGSPELTPNRFAVAVAQFQVDVLRATDTPLSRYQAGDTSALSEAAGRGAEIFKANCAVCHSGVTFTSGLAANNGFESLSPTADVGLEKTTGNRAHRRMFKIPGLVAVAMRAPYGHNGVMESLDRVVRHYGGGAVYVLNGQKFRDDFVDPRVSRITLDPQQQADLLALLQEGFTAYDYPRAEDVVPKELPR